MIADRKGLLINTDNLIGEDRDRWLPGIGRATPELICVSPLES
jgi:hypothetical protein